MKLPRQTAAKYAALFSGVVMEKFSKWRVMHHGGGHGKRPLPRERSISRIFSRASPKCPYLASSVLHLDSSIANFTSVTLCASKSNHLRKCVFLYPKCHWRANRVSVDGDEMIVTSLLILIWNYLKFGQNSRVTHVKIQHNNTRRHSLFVLCKELLIVKMSFSHT